MGIELRTATPDDTAEMHYVDGRAFGVTYEEAAIEAVSGLLEFGRFQLAIDGGRIVGIAGVHTLEVTVPGGSTVRAGGLTWVSVQTTHRRQGLLRRLIHACHTDMDERGEAVAMLGASEGGIYERFGYGIASHGRVITLDRRFATIRPDLAPAPGSVWFIDDDEALDQLPPLWERFRHTRPGEIGRSLAWHKLLLDRRRKPAGGQSAGFHLRHADGYVGYRITQDPIHGMPVNQVDVAEFVACTPDAHLALWATLLSMDLAGPITYRKATLDDPLPYLLTDGRAVRTSAIDDYLWAQPRDVGAAFGARTYGTTDRLVVEADGQRWAIDGSPEGAACRKVRSRPDLTTTAAGLGALLFGGVRASVLAAGRRLDARDAAVLRRADAFFAADRLPFCQTGF